MSESEKKKGFEPGKSGNPGGWGAAKLRNYRELAQYIRDKTNNGRDIVDVCLTVMQSSEADGRTKLLACKELFDRGFGKPVQTIDLNVDDQRPADRPSPTWDGLSIDEKRRLLEAAEQLSAITEPADDGSPTEH